MAVQLPQKRRGRYVPMAEINVTPFVDVVLVLLIIFMVAAPMLTVGVPVDLPRTNAAPLNNPDEPLVVTIDAQGAIFLQQTPTQPAELVPRLQAIAANRAEARIFVRADRSIPYGRVMEVMGLVSSGGFSRVALLAEQPQGAAPQAAPRPPAPRPPAR